MSNSVGRVDLDLGLNYKQFNNELSGVAHHAESTVGEAFKHIGVIIAEAFAVKELFEFGKASIELASNLIEVQNVVDVTFGSMAEHVNNFAKNALYTFGLSELSAKKYASTMGAMLKSSGLTGKAVVALSESMTGLSADFASFYNISQDDAFEKIRSGISGETEPLKQLGINMSVANLQAFALTQGIKKQYQNMTQAEQVLLRYNYLMKVSKDAQGDFARTSTSWANQTRLLSEQWKIFQGTMGQGFMNILAPVLQGLNALIKKLQVAALYFKAFTEAITGVKQQAGSSNGAAAAVDDLGGAASGTGKDVKKAGKEIKGSLSGFDQLNVISQQTADAMGDIADGASGTASDVALPDVPSGPKVAIDTSAMQPVLEFLNQVKTTAGEVYSALEKAFGPSIGSAISSLLPTLDAWKKTLSETFSQVSTLAAPFKAWLSNDLVPYIQQWIGSAADILNGLLDSGRKVFEGIRDAAMPVLNSLVTDGLPLITEFASGLVSILQTMFDDAKSIFDKLWSEGVSPGLMLLSHMYVDVIDSLKKAWDTFGIGIVGGIQDAFDSITEVFKSLWDNFLGPIWNNMLKEMKWLWDNHLKNLVDQVLAFVGKLVDGALQINNKFIMPIVKWLIETFGPTFSKIFSLVADIIGSIVGVVIDVAAGVFKALGGIIDFIVGVFTGDWDKAWTGIKEVFGGIWDAIKGILKGAINIMIDLLNFFIRYWNDMKLEVPKVDLGPLGTYGGFTLRLPHIGEIPKLAKGGLVSSPTLAMVGDNKGASTDPEVVTPLSKLQGMLGASNQAVVEVLYMILDAIENQQMSLEIDGDKLTRYIRDKLRIEGGRVGRSTVTVGGVPLR